MDSVVVGYASPSFHRKAVSDEVFLSSLHTRTCVSWIGPAGLSSPSQLASCLLTKTRLNQTADRCAATARWVGRPHLWRAGERAAAVREWGNADRPGCRCSHDGATPLTTLQAACL